MIVNPMLAKIAGDTKAAFTDPALIWEIKYDGGRTIAVRNGKTQLISRSGRDCTDNFPELDIRTKLPAVLDGEALCRDENGKPAFSLIQHRSTRLAHIKQAMKDYPVEYAVFDILEADGKDVTKLPLSKRKALLNRILIPTDTVYLAPTFKNGKKLFKEMEQKGWEGVMGKRIDGRYMPGSRTWLKVKCGLDEDFTIVGYTAGTGWRSDTFGALELMGPDGKYAGSVGTGFDTDMIEAITRAMKKLPTASCPFGKTPELATWIKPQLKCRVHFAEYTNDRKLRFPSFKRMVK